MKLSYTTPDFFPRFSISKIIYLCDFFIVSPSIFRSWMVLFFPSYLFVFSCNFSRELFISHLKCPISIKRSTFKSKTCFSSVLGFLGLAVVVLCLLGFCWQCFFFLTFAFHHLLVSGVNWSHSLCLKLVPPEVLHTFLSIPGRPVLPWNRGLGLSPVPVADGAWKDHGSSTVTLLCFLPSCHTRVWQSLKQKWHFYL